MTFTAPIQLPGLTLDPQWYKRSVFYECMIRSFVDSNGDGIGDIQGVIGKLALGSIGPSCTEAMRNLELEPDFEPEHGKMGHLVLEAAKKVLEVLARKRA